MTGCARMATYRKLSPSGIRPSGVTESTDISLSLIDQTSGVNKIQVPRQWLLNLFSYIVAFGPVDAGIQIGGIMSLTAGNNRTVLCFSGIFTFLVDAYPMYAASALAANSFARSSFAGESSSACLITIAANSSKLRFHSLAFKCMKSLAFSGLRACSPF